MMSRMMIWRYLNLCLNKRIYLDTFQILFYDKFRMYDKSVLYFMMYAVKILSIMRDY